MDSRMVTRRLTNNLLTLEEFSICNPKAQIRRITAIIADALNGDGSADVDTIREDVTAVVVQNELDGRIDPEETWDGDPLQEIYADIRRRDRAADSCGLDF